MAHDKVYVRIAEDDNFGTASIEPRPFTEAYIRKDALLEWIEEYRNILSESLKNKHSPVTAGKMYVLIKLLDKLNSM